MNNNEEAFNDVCKVLNKINDLPLYGVPDDDIQYIRKKLYDIMDHLEGSKG